MMDSKQVVKFLDDVGENEILKLREYYNEHNSFRDYFYKMAKKIFTKLVSPYFRFDIMLKCIIDIKDNIESYPNMTKEQRKKINVIFKKLQKICAYLNVALNEYYKMCLELKKI